MRQRCFRKGRGTDRYHMQEWENQPVDYYKILQCDPGAERDVLEGAYKKLCKYHPDKPGGNEERFKKINKAWEVVRDVQKRHAYDTWYQNHYTKGNTTAVPPPRPPKIVVEPSLLRFDDLYPGQAKSRSFVITNEGGAFSSGAIDPPDPQGPLKLIQPSGAQLPLTVAIEAVGTKWGENIIEDIIIRFDGVETRLRVEIHTRSLSVRSALGIAGRLFARIVRKIRTMLASRQMVRTIPARRTPARGKRIIGWILAIILILWGGSMLMKMTGQQFVFIHDLTLGARGDDVTELQRRLASEGVYRTAVTGYFGEATEAAVKAYQKTHGVEPTGIVGPQTRAQLNGNEPDPDTAKTYASDTSVALQAGAAAAVLQALPLSDSPAVVVVTLVDESGKPALDATYKSSPEKSGGYMPHITVTDSLSGSVVWQKECLMQGSCGFGHPHTGIFETVPLPVGKYVLKVTIPAGAFETTTVTLAEKAFEVKGDQKILSLGSITLIGFKSSP